MPELIAEIEAHTGYATAAAFAPDDVRLFTVGGDGHLKAWSAEDFSPVADLPGHAKTADALALSADGRLGATGSVDGTVRVWDIGLPAERAVIDGHRGKTVAGVALSPDGARLASAGYDHTVRLWDVESCEQLAEMKHPGNAVAVAFAPDGKLIATGGLGDSIRLWSRHGEDVGEIAGHERAVMSVRFSRDGLAMYSTGAEDTFAIHAVDDWKLVRRTPLSAAGVHAIAVAPDGTRAAVSVDKGVDLIALPSAELTETLPVPVKGVYGVGFSADGTRLAAACADGRVRVWRL